MSDWLAAEAQVLGLSDRLVHDLDLCANEAVTNIISYGWDDDRDHSIALYIATQGGRVTLEIEDDGRAFNPLELPERGTPKTVLEAPVGGLGIKLIREMMPGSRYERRGGRNVLTLSAAIG